jgi:hypothetical protein
MRGWVAGAVDFAVLFVANYGSARGKKYSDPTDLGHAVEMLREVLGQVRMRGTCPWNHPNISWFCLHHTVVALPSLLEVALPSLLDACMHLMSTQ